MFKTKKLRFVTSFILVAIIVSSFSMAVSASQLSIYSFTNDTVNGSVKATGGNQLNVHSGTDYFHDYFATLRTDHVGPSNPAHTNYGYRIEVYGNTLGNKIYESPTVNRKLNDANTPCYYNTGTKQVSLSAGIHTMISRHYVYLYGTSTLFCPTITVTAYGSDAPN